MLNANVESEKLAFSNFSASFPAPHYYDDLDEIKQNRFTQTDFIGFIRFNFILNFVLKMFYLSKKPGDSQKSTVYSLLKKLFFFFVGCIRILERGGG